MNLEILKNKKIIIGLTILILFFIVGTIYILSQESNNLTVNMGGQEVPEETAFTKFLNLIQPAWVGGIIAEGAEGGPWVYEMSPGSSGTMNVGVWNDYSNTVPMWYWIVIRQDGDIIYTTDTQEVAGGMDYDWFFTYTAPSTPGTYEIKLQSYRKTSEDSGAYNHDDFDEFEVKVTQDAPPDLCENFACEPYCSDLVDQKYYHNGYCTIYNDEPYCNYDFDYVIGKCGYTGEPNDPCVDVDCPDKCAEPFTWQYEGTCVDGDCQYTEIANSVECGYVEPTPGPTPAPGETPAPEPTPTVAPPSGESESFLDATAPDTPGEVPEEDILDKLRENIYLVGIIALVVVAGAAYVISTGGLINIKKK